MLRQRAQKEEESVLRDYFFCPKCDHVRPYKLRRASVDFTFYFLPLFEIEDHEEYVVCQGCKRGFNPRILHPSNQHLFRLVWAAKCELHRSSPETFRSKLLKDGYKEPLVDQLMMLARY
jgi:transcription elongation factor Elf1